MNAAAPQQPTVSLKASGHGTLTIQTGTTTLMSWTSANATSCTANSDAGFAGFTATQPFNQVSVRVTSLAGVATTVNVYRACVSFQ